MDPTVSRPPFASVASGASAVPAAAPRPSASIVLAAVSKRFPGTGRQSGLLAVDDVSLQIGAGERFGIIGSSGAGKSTLLRLINLLERPDAGRVVVDGRDLTRLSRRDLRDARAGIGMIFQQFNLLQNATVYDNVAFPLTIQRSRGSQAERRARVVECLKIVGLSSKLDSYPAQLSGGQKQRVAIARALATRPAVLLCDEPTSALDSETTRAVLDVLGDINGCFGVTLVVVTHELAVARTLCERVAVMADGRIVEDLRLADTGDRLETAIARAVRSGEEGDEAAANDRLSTHATPDAQPNPPTSRTSARGPRRVGGLPLPSRTATATVDAAQRDALDAKAAAANSHWMRHFAEAALTADRAATRRHDRPAASVATARRVGGLPLPGPCVPEIVPAIATAIASDIALPSPRIVAAERTPDTRTRAPTARARFGKVVHA